VHLLLVDDDHDVRETLGRLLELDHHVVYRAADGREALRQFETLDTLDAVIVDLMMPRMDGVEFLRALREHERFASVAAIAITAASVEPSYAIANGATAFLRKPFLFDELTEALAEAVGRTRKYSTE
jgi:two-component system, OmpR family, response regulator VicR